MSSYGGDAVATPGGGGNKRPRLDFSNSVPTTPKNSVDTLSKSPPLTATPQQQQPPPPSSLPVVMNGVGGGDTPHRSQRDGREPVSDNNKLNSSRKDSRSKESSDSLKAQIFRANRSGKVKTTKELIQNLGKV